MMPARGAAAYRRVDAQSRSPLELVVMLYDGGLRFVGEARDATSRRDRLARANAISRALAIVGELQNTLNMEQGGAIAEELDRLYSYLTSRLVEATATGGVEPLDEAQKLLGMLREAWSQAAGSRRA
ncbi:MAG: flagellar export chaperone FliS [Vicinamibacterales bacterium]